MWWSKKRDPAMALPQDGHADLRFAGRDFERDIAEDNFLFVGQRGSGKTLSIRLLAQCVIAGFAPESGRRAVVYDPKGDWPSILRGTLQDNKNKGLPCESKIINLNPFDENGYAYDIAADFAALASRKHPRPISTVADGFAKALIPDKSLGGDNKFWVSSAQGIVSGLVQSFAKRSPNKWTLRDVISAACDPRLVEAVLNRDPITRRIIDRFAGSEKTRASVLQTVASFVWDIEPAATAWDHHLKAGRRFTCGEWFASEDILVLCGNYDPPAAVEPINGILMNFIREHLISQGEIDWSDPTHPETWFLLDEFPRLHTIRDMADFFTLTRSKGGVQVIGLQSVTDMYERYGENAGNTILGLCGNLGVLRLTCPKTAEYFESRIGSYELFREYRSVTEQKSVTSSSQGPSTGASSSVSTQRQFHTVPGVMKQELFLLDPVRREGLVIDGWYVIRGRYERLPYSASQAGLAAKLKERDEDGNEKEDFNPLSPDLCDTRPWDDGDFARLGVTAPKGYSDNDRETPPLLSILEGTALRWFTDRPPV